MVAQSRTQRREHQLVERPTPRESSTAVVKSSSTSGQWIPRPPPAKSREVSHVRFGVVIYDFMSGLTSTLTDRGERMQDSGPSNWAAPLVEQLRTFEKCSDRGSTGSKVPASSKAVTRFVLADSAGLVAVKISDPTILALNPLRDDAAGLAPADRAADRIAPPLGRASRASH